MSGELTRAAAAEAAGTALLVATVIGSGIMAERLADGNLALALLGNTLSTGCMLVVLIAVFGPISGAHFNPAVTLVFAAQLGGALLGVLVAHAMFEVPLLQVSAHARTGTAQWMAEGVATFGLIGTILGVSRSRPEGVAYMVGLYIAGAYWFTSSTSFANPAVTAARALTDSFAGIDPAGVPAFVAAQLAGATLAWLFFGWLFASRGSPATRPIESIGETSPSAKT